MKKRMPILLILIAVMFAMGIQKVEAKSCSGVQAAPHMFQVSPYKKAPTFNLQTAQNVCKGSNTEVWFSGIKSLPDSWTYASGNLWIDLFEEDPAGNDDEHVKSYIGWITNKTITSIVLDGTVTPGNIDSVGDQTCELYLRMVSSGQYGKSIEKSLFNYNICMN